MAISAPSRAKARATARPMPLSAPVIECATTFEPPGALIAQFPVVNLRTHFCLIARRRLLLLRVGWLLVNFSRIFSTHDRFNPFARRDIHGRVFISALSIRDTGITRHRATRWRRLKVGSRRDGAWPVHAIGGRRFRSEVRRMLFTFQRLLFHYRPATAINSDCKRK